MSPDNRNLLAAMVLSFAILIGWQAFFIEPEIEAERARLAAEALLEDPVSSGAMESAAASASAGASGAASSVSEEIVEAARITIDAPRLSGSLTTAGARIDDLLMLDYQNELGGVDDAVRLLNPVDSELPYFLEMGWVSADVNHPAPSSKTVWQTNDSVLSPETPVTLYWNNGNGLTFERRIEIDDDYLFSITDSVNSTLSAPVVLNPYGFVRRHGTPELTGIYILHEGPLAVFDEKLNEEDYSDLKKAGAEGIQFAPEVSGGWIGITDKYWLTALIPNQNETVSYSMRSLGGGQDRYQTDFLGAPITIEPGEQISWSANLFAGAKKLSVLDDYAETYNIANFDLAIDFGWFYFLTKPFFYAINWLYGVFGNFGLAVLGFTVIVKLVFFPLANKSYRSMAKMRLLAPKLQTLRERFGDDRMKLNQEMMALYKAEQVNPAAGCLPVLLQIPVFFALYKVLFVTIEMRHAPFFGWVADLSAPDPTSIFNLFGLLPYSVSFLPSFLQLGVWPILMGISMFLQMRLNPAPPDPIQAKVFQFMPIFFTFLLATFPAGLVIYWTWNNLLSMAQQWYIMKRVARG